MQFTHFNSSGRAKMVDVGEKKDTNRLAVAIGSVRMKRETADMIRSGGMKKGDVISVAQVGGIMGAKKTSELIPMCHNIFISGVDMDFEILEYEVKIRATARTCGKTGIEMEAMTAVSIAALTIYDMCKAVDKEMVIGEIMLVRKSGGKSGEFVRRGENL
ncbi:cyclic pyranopterin phosphate synthase [Peptoclostridium litorale DSM 5388]|uniref:Cyclic pyranopterin monophosphate synthase n=1 Tax=Peptoclostridium litorale DSM 5388 TaxID=1121324 RepID=A0A069RDN6_PEPLI|nr:cyclic pyranopterin monophosphate synthase MoaC [Peptoclostridium litorale]KDR94873.1 cyclic pyranopterin monophosphate synthase accessory protein MoaC [Peptoclostridium litorale DSM 5388]SIN94599.1 cyclic pyranopterin phosphate synthase [Peptoclostridium litorale DSM 5388]